MSTGRTQYQERERVNRKWVRLAVMAILIGLSPVWTIAKDRATTQDTATGTTINHEIVKIKDLIQDFNESSWTVVTESGSQLNSNEDGIARVSQEEIRGYWDTSGQYVETDRVEGVAIDIDALPVSIDNVIQVRGSYVLQMPQYKRIQLEIMYDLILDDLGNIPDGEFYIEVLEHNRLNLNEWIKMGQIVQKEKFKQEEPCIKKNQNNEKFAAFSYIANLSEWAGKEIRIDLVSDFTGNKSNSSKGCWRCSRLMGATFDFTFARLVEKNSLNGVSTKSARRMYVDEKRPLTNTPSTIEGDFSTGYPISVSGLCNYPESFKIIRNSDASTSWFLAYFQAGIPYYDDWLDEIIKWPGSATVVCDLYSTNSNFYIVTNTTFNDSMIRNTGSGPGRSNNSNYPVWRALYPVRDEYHWANGMTAVGSAFKDGSYVHTFFHAEDWYKNPPTFNHALGGSTGWWAYSRIGYARSNQNDPYRLNITSSSSDGPIIVSLQSESALSQVSYATSAVLGAAHPLVLKKGNDLYLYYNRFLEYAMIDGNPYSYESKSTGGIGRESCSLCIAKAAYSSVVSTNYLNQPNPWYKFYDGSFSELGSGGLSTPLFDLDDGEPHRGYLVPISVMDHDGIDEYLYVFMNPVDRSRTSNRMYLCTSINKDPCDLSDCIEVELPESKTFCLDMVHEDGYDTEGDGECMMMYAQKPLSSGGFEMIKYQFYFSY